MQRHLLTTVTAAAVGLLTFTAPALADADLAALPVDPNVITDSTAYVGQPPLFDPNGQPGIQQTFTHRDGSRTIVDTILTTSSPQAAVEAMDAARATTMSTVIGSSTQSAPVGQNGVTIKGTSPDQTHAVTVLLFTRGAAAAEIKFEGGHGDPVPTDLVIDYGQRQDDAIQQR